jgi:urocanate hydratase
MSIIYLPGNRSMKVPVVPIFSPFLQCDSLRNPLILFANRELNTLSSIINKGGVKMDYGLSGKVAIITGGSSGIGKAIAAAFTAEGAIAVINSRDQAKIDKACDEIGPVEFLVNNIDVLS